MVIEFGDRLSRSPTIVLNAVADEIWGEVFLVVQPSLHVWLVGAVLRFTS